MKTEMCFHCYLNILFSFSEICGAYLSERYKIYDNIFNFVKYVTFICSMWLLNLRTVIVQT